MKKSAFTLMEVLMAMAIIGIVATATVNSIKNVSANKTKMAFQNCYNHIVQTVDKIVSDEEFYPNVIQLDSVDTNDGRNTRKSMCRLYIKFHTQFAELSKYNRGTYEHPSSDVYKFETTGGTFWLAKRQTTSCQTNSWSESNMADYIVVFDVDGINEGPNCPYDLTDVSSLTPTNCTNPDTFLFGISGRNEVIPDNSGAYYNSDTLSEFMRKNNYLNTK